MIIYILGGFLGSGKTSLLMELISHYSKENRKVAILVNELGEIGVDGATIKANGFKAVELTDGCICCSLSGSLQSTLQAMARELNPDIILIEPTGLALPGKIGDLVHYAMLDEEAMYIIGIADAERMDDLITRKEAFFKGQMKSSEFILLNKCDLIETEELDKTVKFMESEFPGKKIIPISMKTGKNLDKVMELMEG